jgi:regulatory protein
MSQRPPSSTSDTLRQRALRLLATREHSHAELLRKLEQSRARRARANAGKTATSDDIARIVRELAQAGWQSDARYAEALVRRLTGQASRRYIQNKLAEVGIGRDVAEAALAELDQDDAAAAAALWQRRFGAPPRDEKDRRRQIRFLLSRGFHLSEAFRIVPPAVTPSGRTRAVDGPTQAMTDDPTDAPEAPE